MAGKGMYRYVGDTGWMHSGLDDGCGWNGTVFVFAVRTGRVGENFLPQVDGELWSGQVLQVRPRRKSAGCKRRRGRQRLRV